MKALHVVNERGAPAALFVPALTALGIEVETRRPLDGDPLPETLAGYAGMVVGGGVIDTHEDDRYPFLRHETALFREAVERGVPALGLCLGSQILCRAVGGEVVRSEPPEVGFEPVSLEPAADADALFAGLPASFPAFEWHYYAIAPPDAATLLARNAVCAQAFRAGERAWGMQFHIEVTREILLRWGEEGREELERQGHTEAAYRRAVDEQVGAHEAIGRRLAGRFAAECAGRAGIAAGAAAR